MLIATGKYRSMRDRLHIAVALCSFGWVTACSVDDSPGAAVSAAEDTAGRIEWFDGSVETAFAAAKAQRQPVFLYWGAEWCPYCKQVEATIFTRDDVIDRLQQFVAVALDGDAPAAQQAGERFRVRGYPTMIVFGPDGDELTRIPNGLDPGAYAAIFDLALDAERPIAAIVDDVLADVPVDAHDWRRLAVYSWGQDNESVLEARDPQDVFRRLSDACPAAVPKACTRLGVNYIDAMIESAGSETLDPGFRAEAIDQLNTILADDALVAANLDTVLHAGPRFVDALTAPGSAQRKTLAGRWQAAMLVLADDPSVSTVDQLYASYAPVGFLRMENSDAPVPAVVQETIMARVARARAATADPVERHPVIVTASGLLRAIDKPDEAVAMLEDELATSSQPHYLMSALASAAERNGDVDGLLEWRERAYYAASGAETRFRWGYGYAVRLIEHRPDDVETIEAVVVALFGEIEDPVSAFYGGTQERVKQLHRRLVDWADDDARAASLGRMKDAVTAVCERIPAAAESRQRCDNFLVNEAS